MLANYDIFKDEDNGCYQIRSKTSIYAIVFDEEISERIFLRIVEISSQDKDISLPKLKKDLLGKFEESQVMSVLHNLREVGLIPEDRSINATEQLSTFRDINDTSLVIIGNSKLAKALSQVCETEKFKAVDMLAYETKDFEQKISQVFKDYDFVVVDAHQWSPFHLEIINKTAVELNKPWLYM